MNGWGRLLIVALFATALFAISGCGSSKVSEGTVVSIIYTSDVHGRLEGCGCQRSGGGVAHRSAQIKKAREADPNVVYCDAGNFMAGSPDAQNANGAVVAAYNHMNASVANVSEYDLASGVEPFRNLRKEAKFDFVSANLRYKGGALADPLVMKKINGARVAFVGVCGTREVMRIDSMKLPEGVTVEDPMAAVRQAVVGLDQKADLVVVLSTCGDAMDSLFVESIPGIDLVIGGRSYRPNAAEPWKFETARIVRAEHDGRTMGRMDMEFGPDGKVKQFIAKEIALEMKAPADAEAVAVVKKFIPEFSNVAASAAAQAAAK